MRRSPKHSTYTTMLNKQGNTSSDGTVPQRQCKAPTDRINTHAGSVKQDTSFSTPQHTHHALDRDSRGPSCLPWVHSQVYTRYKVLYCLKLRCGTTRLWLTLVQW